MEFWFKRKWGLLRENLRKIDLRKVNVFEWSNNLEKEKCWDFIRKWVCYKVNNLKDKQCAIGRGIKQVGSEAEKCGINWQVCGNLDSNGGIYNQWMEKKDYFTNDIEAIDYLIGGGEIDLYLA